MNSLNVVYAMVMVVVLFVITAVFIFGTHQSTADPLRNKAVKIIFALLFSNWDRLVMKYRINWVRNLLYLFRLLMNSLGRLIFNMGLWEVDARVGIGTGNALIRAVTVVIVTAGDKGGPEGPR